MFLLQQLTKLNININLQMHPDTLYCSMRLLCFLYYQGRGPTCSSCWAADWLAAALHEGWVKGQEGLHDPAQPGNHLFHKLSFWRLQTSFKSKTTCHLHSFLHKSRHTSVKFNTQTLDLTFHSLLLNVVGTSLHITSHCIVHRKYAHAFDIINALKNVYAALHCDVRPYFSPYIYFMSVRMCYFITSADSS